MGALGQYRKNLPIWKTETLDEWIQKVEEVEAQTIANINRSHILRNQKDRKPNSPSDSKDTKAEDSQTTRSEEHTSELQSQMRISYAVFCLKKKKTNINTTKKQ